ncbi:hypothetical protein IDH44_14780 [Paenibacillus sp. IB182496]|uniref:Uncharacterized protein n=1 Tax=Paenibacillus sabuli TaxID=2772509 RepID=A0A927GS84_9BACL|nr:hypothetical protein [Paenibacillus sabuli]MBD2846464.1 hypothetical protein [Paenibacillus sabuli]
MIRYRTLAALGAAVLVLLGLNNAWTYAIASRALEQGRSHELGAVARQLELSIEQARQGAEKHQDMIGRQLRTAAIAAQYALDPDIEMVTNEQLVELSAKLGVLHITLLKRTKDDIVLYRSSDPKQLGVSTKSWDPWHDAFVQLFERREVTIDWGQSLPNFWTGPFELATSDTSKVRKWGYYYDGSTNYIIDPYVSYDIQAEYEALTGVDRIIEQTIAGHEGLREIAVLNPATFESGEVMTRTEAGEELGHITTQPVIYGSYTYTSAFDAELVRTVYTEGEPAEASIDVGGEKLRKTFIPVSIDPVASMVDAAGQPIDRYILALVTEEEAAAGGLGAWYALATAVVAALAGTAVYLAFRQRA